MAGNRTSTEDTPKNKIRYAAPKFNVFGSGWASEDGKGKFKADYDRLVALQQLDFSKPGDIKAYLEIVKDPLYADMTPEQLHADHQSLSKATSQGFTSTVLGKYKHLMNMLPEHLAASFVAEKLPFYKSENPIYMGATNAKLELIALQQALKSDPEKVADQMSRGIGNKMVMNYFRFGTDNIIRGKAQYLKNVVLRAIDKLGAATAIGETISLGQKASEDYTQKEKKINDEEKKEIEEVAKKSVIGYLTAEEAAEVRKPYNEKRAKLRKQNPDGARALTELPRMGADLGDLVNNFIVEEAEKRKAA